MALQPSLLRETAALVPKTGAAFVCFELSGPPFGKQVKGQTIRYTADGKPYIHSYVEPETAAYMESLAWAARGAMKGRKPSLKPIWLQLHCYIPIPKSWTKREKADALIGAIRPAVRPDDDNYKKSLDALNEIVWKDDGQIVEDHIYKFYSDDPALRIEVREFVPPSENENA